MKRLIAVSDSHGNAKAVEKLLPLIKENHYFVHLGDGLSDLRAVLDECAKKTYFCSGNCDFYSGVSDEGILEIEKVKIFYCHGHGYGVKGGLSALAKKAKECGCQLALYGHTHRAGVCEIDGVTLVNPGSLRYPFGEGGSYAYIVINGEKITAVIVGESVG
ncbi:MAG: metallophosphoesterase [Clostridia bacterium]|nr:metallophosphoesterase [Clostridia bacterium]